MSGMEGYKLANGKVLSQPNYRQNNRTRNRNCYCCGKRGHFVRDCPSKRRNNGAQVKPKNQQKFMSDLNQQPAQCNRCQEPVMGIWTDDSMESNFKGENKSGYDLPWKISASNFQECFSPRPSYFSSASNYAEPYSSSASDYSEDYISTALDSLEDYSYEAYGSQYEDHLSSASESSSTLYSSEVISSSSSVSDLLQFMYSSASDSRTVYASSDRDKCDGNDLSGSKDCEEAQPLQRATLSMDHKESDKYLQSPIVTSLDSAECHKVVQTMYNLSMLLLNNLSESDNLNKSDLQALQSVICNLSQCLMKRTGVPKSADESTFMPDKPPVPANLEETEKDFNAAEEMEDPAGERFFQFPAEVFQSQMVNIEVELNLIKSEIRSLRSDLEMDGLKRNHAATHENKDIETKANKNDVNDGSCPEANTVVKKIEPDYTLALFSQETSNWLPDLNLDPIRNDESFISECYIQKYEDEILSQNNNSGEPIHKSILSATAANSGQPNDDAEAKQLEGEFIVLQESSSCSQPDMEYIKDYSDKRLQENCANNDSCSEIGSPIYTREIENVDVVHALDEYQCFTSDSSWDQFVVEDGAMIGNPTKAGSPMEVGHVLVENLCSESDSSWEELNFNEEYCI